MEEEKEGSEATSRWDLLFSPLHRWAPYMMTVGGQIRSHWQSIIQSESQTGRGGGGGWGGRRGTWPSNRMWGHDQWSNWGTGKITGCLHMCQVIRGFKPIRRNKMLALYISAGQHFNISRRWTFFFNLAGSPWLLQIPVSLSFIWYSWVWFDPIWLTVSFGSNSHFFQVVLHPDWCAEAGGMSNFPSVGQKSCEITETSPLRENEWFTNHCTDVVIQHIWR